VLAREQLQQIKVERKTNSDVLSRFQKSQTKQIGASVGSAERAEELKQALLHAELKQHETEEMLKRNTELEHALKLSEERAALLAKQASEREEEGKSEREEGGVNGGAAFDREEVGAGDRSSAPGGQSELERVQEQLQQSEARALRAERRAEAESNLRKLKLQPRSERLLAFERFKVRQRKFRVAMSSLVKMQGMVRRARARKVAVARAASLGSLLAMPGTISGESGWYEGESGHVCEFEVSKKGDWLSMGEPVERSAWVQLMRDKKRVELQRIKMEAKKKSGVLSDFERMKAKQRALLGDGQG
jgi:hypothetical protein